MKANSTNICIFISFITDSVNSFLISIAYYTLRFLVYGSSYLLNIISSTKDVDCVPGPYSGVRWDNYTLYIQRCCFFWIWYNFWWIRLSILNMVSNNITDIEIDWNWNIQIFIFENPSFTFVVQYSRTTTTWREKSPCNLDESWTWPLTTCPNWIRFFLTYEEPTYVWSMEVSGKMKYAL